MACVFYKFLQDKRSPLFRLSSHFNDELQVAQPMSPKLEVEDRLEVFRRILPAASVFASGSVKLIV
jgi:hypothetical protein